MGKIFKICMRILFSHLGLCLIIVAYAVGGAYLFRYIELPDEKRHFNESQTQWELIRDQKEYIIKYVIEFCRDNPQMPPKQAIKAIKDLLDIYQNNTIQARIETLVWPRSAYTGRKLEENYGWDISGAILFTATILSTVGYGQVYPVTDTGYLVCVLYSVFAIPLMSMFLVNISNLLVKGAKHFYGQGCCFFLRRKRQYNNSIAISMRPSSSTDNFERPRSAWDDRNNYYRSDNDGVTHYSGNNRQVMFENENPDTMPENNLIPVALSIVLFACYFTFGMIVWSATTTWSLLESSYFTIITLMTIGFGDYVPGSQGAHDDNNDLKLGFCALYIVVGSAVLTTTVGLGFETVRTRYRQQRRNYRQHNNRNVKNDSIIYDESHGSDLTPPQPYLH